MNARYNGLYHSELLLNESIDNLKKGNKDDFNKVISVFPFGTKDDAGGEKSSLDEVFKKASKLIRKHPKSRWVDDGWFLIGKSYFFQRESFTAIETFQHVVNQYPDGERKYDAKLWIVMAYIQQEKYYDAEAIMALLNNEKDIPRRLLKDKAAIAAEIYIRQDKYAQAITELEKALSLTRTRDERSRYHFILGQLYLLNNDVLKSKQNFTKTIRLNPPYELAFQSNLGLIKTISLSANKSLKTPKKHLNRMLKDDKNINYYDQIYYQLATLELKDGNKDAAIEYFRLSASNSVDNKDQKANSYLALATLFFEDKNYPASQRYFDSTAMFMSDKRSDYELIRAKQSVLTDLIENLVNIFEQDSLLRLSILPKDQLDRRINQKIQEDQRIAEQAARDKADNQQNNFVDPFNQPNKTKTNSTVGGEWYFYNPSAVTRGTNDFKRKWGERSLADNWRFASLAGRLQDPKTQPKESVDTTTITAAVDPKVYNPANDKEKQDRLQEVEESKRKYYEDIPFSQGAKDAANQLIAKSLFSAGKIYEEDLKEFSKAKGYFLKLLERYPGNALEAETYFHLHRIAGFEKDETEQAKYSALLNSKYPKSPFNLVINNREVLEGLSTDKEISILYQKAYDAYQAEDYDAAEGFKNEADEKYAGNALQAKFDYLQTLIIGKTQGEQAYVLALTRLKENYPGTTIANTATYTIELLAQKKEDQIAGKVESKFKYEATVSHFFISIYDGGTSAKVQAAFSDYNQEQHKLETLKVTSYAFGNKNIVAIQPFADKATAEKYYIEFIKNDQFFKSLDIQAYENFTISADNFRILLGDQNSDAYSEFFFTNYIQ